MTSGDDLNLEFIAAQQPDLIIGGGPGWPGQQTIKNYDKLAAVAPTALVPSDLAKWPWRPSTCWPSVSRSDRAAPRHHDHPVRRNPAGGVITFRWVHECSA
ncbi:hypothetical protein BOX37_05010 [Nocardia mangyaensis]|uniref:Uncharacterized protein n=1 Tax=Nocardia mangyaensis TaxID=2213200 RepID=A0A1J0VN31_9NOCA|nr:hypothetical protein [Nocardia mangyaensis]APE33430.1 hypothetical protein BOX37_05010 [Nocardia mangyaensis]